MISVVIPTMGNVEDLENCLRSLRLQARKPKEIIVVFDFTNSNTEIAKKYGTKIIFDKKSTIGGAYSAGVRASRGNIIAFIDDDAFAPKNWIAKIEKQFEENIDVVSGEDLLPEKSTFFQRSAYQIDNSRMMKRPVYGIKAKNRLRATNVAYRRNVFREENFDPNLKGLQEPEFHHRLFKKGYRMKFDPGLIVYHKRRNSMSGIFRQIYRNGKAKIRLIKIHRELLSAVDVLPIAFVMAVLVSAFSVLNGNTVPAKYLFFALAAYILAKPFAYLLKTGEIKYYPLLLLIVLVRETAYTIGILEGLIMSFKR